MGGHQIRMSSPELAYFEEIRTLRRMEKASRPQYEFDTDTLKNTSIQVLFRTGDHNLGTHSIGAENALIELAPIVAQHKKKVLALRKKQAEGEAAAEEGAEEGAEAEADAGDTPDLVDDRDSILGTQNVEEFPDEDILGPGDDEEPPSWERMKEAMPSFVKEVCFVVDESAMSALERQELKERFPGVRLIPPPTTQSKIQASSGKQSLPTSKTTEISPEALPEGVTATFMVESAAITRDARIAETLRKRFPGASVKATPNPKAQLTVDTHGNYIRSDYLGSGHKLDSHDSTPSSAHAKKSLADRMSRGDIRIKGAALSPHHSSRGEDTSPRGILEHVVRETKLLVHNDRQLEAMYTQWLQSREVRAYATIYKLDNYYANLADLYVVGDHTEDDDLTDAVLKRWQETSYVKKRDVPDISAAIKAFQYLKVTSPLCEWINIFYSYIWSTRVYDSYDELRDDIGPWSGEAIAKFLFGVSRIRCEYTKGGDVKVLKAWCDWHKHPKDSPTQVICEAERDRITNNCLEIKTKQLADEDIAEAIELLERSGYEIMLPDPGSTSGKRKASMSPPENAPRGPKKIKRGGGSSRGRGASRGASKGSSRGAKGR